MNKFKGLPDSIRKKLIISTTGVFLTFVSLAYLTSPSSSTILNSGLGLDKKQSEEIISLTSKETKKTSFDQAQKLVKVSEAGYSDDKDDKGNWISLPNGERKFIGTNHGISAPVLAKYFKDKGITRLLTKNDMINLSYKTACKIFKKNYWDSQNLGLLKDQNIANIIYDGCVNQGIEGMKEVLTNAFRENGIKIVNGVFSKSDLSKVNKVNQKKLFNSIKKFREGRYRDSQTFRKHGGGWLNRLNEFTYKSEDTQPQNIV